MYIHGDGHHHIIIYNLDVSKEIVEVYSSR